MIDELVVKPTVTMKNVSVSVLPCAYLAKSQNLAGVREIPKINTQKIIGINPQIAKFCDRPQGLLRVLIMLIRTDFPALRGGTGPLSATYRRGILRCWKGIHCLSAAWHFRLVHAGKLSWKSDHEARPTGRLGAVDLVWCGRTCVGLRPCTGTWSPQKKDLRSDRLGFLRRSLAFLVWILPRQKPECYL